MKRALPVLVAALALVLVPLGAAEASYSDPAGDSGPAPDITNVQISNTDDGTVTFKIAIGNYTTLPQFPTAIVGLGLFLDLDKNHATGDNGDEAFASFDAVGGVDLERWDGKALVDVPETNMTSGFSNGLLTFTIARSELLNTTGFTFSVMSMYVPGTGGQVVVDSAPNIGLADWAYDLVLPKPPPPVKPMIGNPAPTPAAPVAGKKFTVRFAVTSSVDGSPLTTATVGCKTTVAGKTVPHVHTFTGGTVKAVVAVPKAAKGKQLKIAVKVTAGAQAATKVVTFKVK